MNFQPHQAVAREGLLVEATICWRGQSPCGRWSAQRTTPQCARNWMIDNDRHRLTVPISSNIMRTPQDWGISIFTSDAYSSCRRSPPVLGAGVSFECFSWNQLCGSPGASKSASAKSAKSGCIQCLDFIPSFVLMRRFPCHSLSQAFKSLVVLVADRRNCCGVAWPKRSAGVTWQRPFCPAGWWAWQSGDVWRLWILHNLTISYHIYIHIYHIYIIYIYDIYI